MSGRADMAAAAIRLSLKHFTSEAPPSGAAVAATPASLSEASGRLAATTTTRASGGGGGGAGRALRRGAISTKMGSEWSGKDGEQEFSTRSRSMVVENVVGSISRWPSSVVVSDTKQEQSSSAPSESGNEDGVLDEIWLRMREEARRDAEAEPALASYLYSTILAHRSLERALAFHLGNKLSSSTLLSTQLFTMIVDSFMEDADIRDAIRADIVAVRERDPACVSYSHCMLNFKGFLACQVHRVSHRLWNQGRISLALALQSRVSEVFHVDIHPAAKIGKGVLFDHATGLVVGETATIGNNVSILHNVTLGGTGAFGGKRHPRICDGVLIGAGAIILGPVEIGEGAKIGAGSVVLIEVPPHTTAVGNPARLVGGKQKPARLKDRPSETMDHTSFISTWSDYVI